MLILIAKFETMSEYREEFISLSEGMLEPSRSEEGCIHYELLQNPFNPDLFTFYEKWRSNEDLEEHFEQPYFLDYINKVPELTIGEGDVIVYNVSGERKVD